MKKILNLTKRNIKLYFNDKGMFITSLITPAILLVLYATFLAKIYESSLVSMIPENLNIPSNIINGLVSGELVSSLLAVSCITVAFCSNLLMVQDKVTGSTKDLLVSPTKKTELSISYFLASFISTLIINVTALILCLIYMTITSRFVGIGYVFRILFDVVLLTLFGCSLSSIINCKLNSQGQISAVGTIISSGYGFICGAYMPISSFAVGLQKFIKFLPGTYGTSMIRNTTMNPFFKDLSSYLPTQTINEIKSGLDCRLDFFGTNVSVSTMYLIMIITDILLIGIYILQNRKSK